LNSFNRLIGPFKKLMMGFPDKLDQYKFLKMEQCIKVNGLFNQIRKMDEVFKYGQMDRDMMDFGDKEWQTDMEDLFMLKETYMKESGLKIKQMGSESILILMGADMKVIGFKISNTVLELSNGQMEQNMKDSMNKA
jgi:hypothetical protein